MNVMTIMLQAAGGGSAQFLIMMVLIFGVMYFLMIRPQQKKQKELVKFRNALEKGQKIVTAGGIYGTVTNVKDDVITISVGPDRVQLVFARGAIANVEDVAVENTMDDGTIKG